MSNSSQLSALLSAIEKDNASRFKIPASNKTLYTGGKGPAPYTHSAGAVNPKTSKGSTHDGGSGPLGILGNLAGDIKDTVTGLPGGIIQTVEHPIATAQAVGHDYRKRYGPLLGYLNGGGDIGKFGHQIAQHPLAPLLDAASVVTGGGALAAKVGQSAHVAAAVDAARAAKVAEVGAGTAPARKAIEVLSKRADKVKVDHAAAELRANNLKAPIDVQASSAKAALKHENTLKGIQDQIHAHTKAIVESGVGSKVPPLNGGVSALEKLQAATSGGTRMLKASKTGGEANIRVPLPNNPVIRARRNLGMNIQESRFLPEGVPMIGLRARAGKAANLQALDDAGRLRSVQRRHQQSINGMEKIAAKSPKKYGQMATALDALVSGVDPLVYARNVKDTLSNINWGAVGKSPEEAKQILNIRTAMHKDPQTVKLYTAAKRVLQDKAVAAGNNVNPIYMQKPVSDALKNSPEVQAIVRAHQTHAAVAEHAMEQMVKTGRLTRDEASQRAVLHVTLSREMQGLKHQSPEQINRSFEKAGLPKPVYNPDTLTIGDSKAVQGLTKESGGKLYKSGARLVEPMNIIMRHELASKATDALTAHKLMLSAATHIAQGEKLPSNWVWIHDKVPKTMEAKNALHNMQAGSGPHTNADFYNQLKADVRPAGGMAMNKKLHEDIAHGQAAMAAARGGVAAKAMTIWKRATLFRPGFVYNNVVGNQLMYHLRNGWNFKAFRDAKRLAGDAFAEHHFSEGAGMGSTFADTLGRNPLGKNPSQAAKAMNSFYTVVGAHEHWLRQMTMYETARKMPQVQRELTALKGGKWVSKDGKTMFHEAYNRAIAKSPHIRDLVTKNMDDTMGNYRYFTHIEQSLKNLSPFYSWERHSIRHLIRTIEDKPATAAILTQMGMQGDARFKRDFGNNMPEFVKSYVQDQYIHALAQRLGLGKNVSMMDFNAVNPWKTAVDVASIAGSGSNAKQALIQAAGPAFTGPYEEISGKSALTRAPAAKTHFSNPIASMLERVAGQTPVAAFAKNEVTGAAAKKKMLPETRAAVLARFFGPSFRNLNKPIAEKMNTAAHAKRDKYGHVISKKAKKPNPFYK